MIPWAAAQPLLEAVSRKHAPKGPGDRAFSLVDKMLDDNWDLISGTTAHEIESLNFINQINLIEALFKFLVHYGEIKDTGCTHIPNETALKEIHRAGTIFLLDKPGEYRQVPVCLKTKEGQVTYIPPNFSEVPALMEEFFDKLRSIWEHGDPIYIASFCLWKINWIHPFKNGNGRAARAFSYACLCLKFGFWLPGTPTVIDLVMANPIEYQGILRKIDMNSEESGATDLSPMCEFIEKLLKVQLSSISNP